MTDEQKAIRDYWYRQGKDDQYQVNADLIEALEAENARLREALDWAIAEIDGRTIYFGSDQFTSEQQFENALEAARAALTQETQP
jgi:outer membrane protein OmpA-like peptidoglycan-associated protein